MTGSNLQVRPSRRCIWGPQIPYKGSSNHAPVMQIDAYRKEDGRAGLYKESYHHQGAKKHNGAELIKHLQLEAPS